jgi:hypothetical protein
MLFLVYELLFLFFTISTRGPIKVAAILCITKANFNKLMPFIRVFILMLDRKEFFKTETKPKYINL